jgi:predicted TIM-barrel fold metal-dependent hydrolase
VGFAVQAWSASTNTACIMANSITNSDSTQLTIIDCHVHFVDAGLRRYPLFQQRSPAFEALVGDYRASPKRYRDIGFIASYIAQGFHRGYAIRINF